MATSGQLNTNTTYDSYFWVKWEQTGDQDIPNNRTKITWSCGVYCGHSFYLNAIKMSAVSINGTQVYGGGTYSNFSTGNHTIASDTMWIGHSADGTKTFSISPFTGWLYSSYNYSSNGGSYSLTAIPRQAAITSAPDFTDVQNPTITYSNPAGNAVTVLKACISLTGATHDIKYRDISKTGSSYTFNLTDEERDLLRNNTAGTSRNVLFFVTTNIGGTEYYSTLTRKFTVTENSKTKPSVGMAVTLNNDLLPGEFAGKYVQGKSRVDVSLDGTGKYKATIKSYSATIDGKTYNSQSFTSDVIQKSGKIIGYAKDSRGFTGSTEQTVTVIEYGKPLVIPLSSENAILCYRSDGNGKRVGNSTSLWIKAKKSYYGVEGKNTCALQWRWKKAAEVWDDTAHSWSDLVPSTATTNEFNALIPGVVFELREAYTIQLRAIDTIGEYDIKTFEVPTQDVALHLGYGGKNVSVGTYCDYSEERTFYSDWKAIFDKEVVIGGEVVMDHVVEQGTSGIWTYEKWHSGKAVCWGIVGTDAESTAGTTAFGDASVAFSSRATAFPSIFLAAPTVFTTPYDTGIGGVSVANDGSTVELCKVTLYGTSTAIGNVSVYATGKWK